MRQLSLVSFSETLRAQDPIRIHAQEAGPDGPSPAVPPCYRPCRAGAAARWMWRLGPYPTAARGGSTSSIAPSLAPRTAPRRADTTLQLLPRHAPAGHLRGHAASAQPLRGATGASTGRQRLNSALKVVASATLRAHVTTQGFPHEYTWLWDCGCVACCRCEPSAVNGLVPAPAALLSGRPALHTRSPARCHAMVALPPSEKPACRGDASPRQPARTARSPRPAGRAACARASLPGSARTPSHA